MALLLSFGLSMNVFASTEVIKTESAISTSSQAVVPVPESVPPIASEADSIPENDNQQPPLSKQEIKGFIQEMKNVSPEAKRVLKDLKTVAASATVDGWRASLNAIVSGAADCINRVNKSPSDEKRDIVDECRSANFFRDVDDIRQQFVPPQEVKRALNEIKNQEKELLRFARQLAKSGGAVLETVKKLQSEAASYRTAIVSGAGQDQRDAMQEWWDARFWESVNNVRAYAEIPKQLDREKKDLARVEAKLAKDTFKKAAAFLSIDLLALNTEVTAKKKALDDISGALASGDGETANELMQEHVYQNWNSGDLLGIIDMSSEVHRVMKNVKDADVKNQLMDVIEPLADAINASEYRDANQALNQMRNQMHQYEQYFRQPASSRFSAKMFKAFDTLEETFRKKFDEQGSAAAPEENQ